MKHFYEKFIFIIGSFVCGKRHGKIKSSLLQAETTEL